MNPYQKKKPPKALVHTLSGYSKPRQPAYTPLCGATVTKRTQFAYLPVLITCTECRSRSGKNHESFASRMHMLSIVRTGRRKKRREAKAYKKDWPWVVDHQYLHLTHDGKKPTTEWRSKCAPDVVHKLKHKSLAKQEHSNCRECLDAARLEKLPPEPVAMHRTRPMRPHIREANEKAKKNNATLLDENRRARYAR